MKNYIVHYTMYFPKFKKWIKRDHVFHAGYWFVSKEDAEREFVRLMNKSNEYKRFSYNIDYTEIVYV